ncbi:MAG TPA: hypothetical protein VK091_00665 [Virgibacillus sp.]|nr:hypothetical protein [Virgibacillus sp.]
MSENRNHKDKVSGVGITEGILLIVLLLLLIFGSTNIEDLTDVPGED